MTTGPGQGPAEPCTTLGPFMHAWCATDCRLELDRGSPHTRFGSLRMAGRLRPGTLQPNAGAAPPGRRGRGALVGSARTNCLELARAPRVLMPTPAGCPHAFVAYSRMAGCGRPGTMTLNGSTE